MFEALQLPLEEALAAGADTRSRVEKDGFNKYGTSPVPNAAIPFGSCTSSSSSPRGFAAAARLQEMLLRSRNPRTVAQATVHTIRRRLRRTLRIPTDVGIALAPSGTDAELLGVAIAAGHAQGRRLVNIVVGPNEVGSGTPQAAAVRHYDALTPSGRTVQPGDPVDDKLAANTELKVVPLRTPDGRLREEADLDREVEALVADAQRQQSLVLLHVVAHSKTGVHAPSLDCVERLQKEVRDLVVMVDAAQGRFSRKGMLTSLQANQLFMITGSKFFGGPPFSGALLIPRRWMGSMAALRPFPVGFADFFSKVEMPPSWRRARAALAAEPNYGLLLRWAAALAEIEAYYQTPGPDRLRVLRFFESEVPRLFLGAGDIQLLTVHPQVLGDERLLQSKTTVFSFQLLHKKQRLDLEALRALHRRLLLPTPSSPQGFHLGQPVKIGDHEAALRVALGGPLIVRVATDHALGSDLETRLEWLSAQLTGLRGRIRELLATPQTERIPLPS